MVHRDLSNPQHKTNLHLHYELPYPVSPDNTMSFFTYPPDSEIRFNPKEPSVHKPLSIKQVMERRLHWTTFGGQYDWTNRVYPGERPPEFPPDLATFLHTLFPETTPQAAIVNFYTPGDTMMMHRDVSEHADRGLISVSIGCDALFMIAASDFGRQGDGETKTNDSEETEKEYLLLRLKSGDIIYMTEEARTAWHGVPKVVKDTCPDYLADWPAGGDEYAEWRGWMKNKRINLNVRQVHE
jgi:DNA alkylation damage repair protein AlkB